MNFFRALSNLLRFDRTNWKALTLCVFAAGVFWIFNALNKRYATNLKFPLHFEYDATRYIAVEPLPASLALNVSGNGWELLRKSLGLKVPTISMPLERPADIHKIVASTLSPVVASQLGTLEVNYIVTDTLRLNIEPTVTRKIKLVANLQAISFKKSFGRTSSVAILPDSVILEGPKSLITALNDTVILNVKASRVDGNVRENVEVQVTNNDLISRNPPVAEVMFEVGAVEEIDKYVKLKTSTTPWGTEVDRDSVRCVFIVPAKDRERFMSENIYLLLTTDMSQLSRGETRSFLPVAKGVPAYADVVHVDSVRVKKY